MRSGSLTDLIRDEVLPRRTFAKVSSWAQDLSFAPMIDQGVWLQNRPHNPLMATTVLWPFRADIRRKIVGIAKESETLPTGTPLDRVLRAIRRTILASPLGRRVAADSAGITASVLRYQPNSGLTWHLDATHYSVAFAYYIHSEWNQNGGGLLMLRDTRHPRELPCAVSPLPNRMVIIPGHFEHCVSLVSDYPGASARIAISGFFVRTSCVDRLIELRQS
jgi:2OG-Fe(II) oxygenase superfamily